MTLMNEFLKGIIKENPIFVIGLGMCPSLAVTTSIENAIGMGMATTFVLLCSNMLISLIKNFIPTKIRIPCFIVVIATFTTICDLEMQAFLPELHKSLGIFIPLIVVNCIILGRAESFASKNNIMRSMLDGIGMGVGFTAALSLVASIRELLGEGKLFGQAILPEAYINNPMLVAIMAPGAFITLGLLLGTMTMLRTKKK